LTRIRFRVPAEPTQGAPLNCPTGVLCTQMEGMWSG
jgi:hypothetical protein